MVIFGYVICKQSDLIREMRQSYMDARTYGFSEAIMRVRKGMYSEDEIKEMSVERDWAIDNRDDPRSRFWHRRFDRDIGILPPETDPEVWARE